MYRIIDHMAWWPLYLYAQILCSTKKGVAFYPQCMMFFQPTELYIQWNLSSKYSQFFWMVTIWLILLHLNFCFCVCFVFSQSYRDVGLYWAGSIINSMLVFLPANFAGKHGDQIKASVIFNIPFAIFPFIKCFLLLKEKRGLEVNPAQVRASTWG